MDTKSVSTGERMSPTERLSFFRTIEEKHRLSHPDLARLTGYALNTVFGWFTTPESPRYREVPARAVDRLLLELQYGNVKGTK
jgi:hypothetical protein